MSMRGFYKHTQSALHIKYNLPRGGQLAAARRQGRRARPGGRGGGESDDGARGDVRLRIVVPPQIVV